MMIRNRTLQDTDKITNFHYDKLIFALRDIFSVFLNNFFLSYFLCKQDRSNTDAILKNEIPLNAMEGYCIAQFLNHVNHVIHLKDFLKFQIMDFCNLK